MTAPAPTVCPTCKGEGWVEQIEYGWQAVETPCPECRCDRCATEVYTRGDGPQLCDDCADDLGDRAYERRADA